MKIFYLNTNRSRIRLPLSIFPKHVHLLAHTPLQSEFSHPSRSPVTLASELLCAWLLNTREYISVVRKYQFPQLFENLKRKHKSGRMPKTFDVVVSTMDSEMEFSIDVSLLGEGADLEDEKRRES